MLLIAPPLAPASPVTSRCCTELLPLVCSLPSPVGCQDESSSWPLPICSAGASECGKETSPRRTSAAARCIYWRTRLDSCAASFSGAYIPWRRDGRAFRGLGSQNNSPCHGTSALAFDLTCDCPPIPDSATARTPASGFSADSAEATFYSESGITALPISRSSSYLCRSSCYT